MMSASSIEGPLDSSCVCSTRVASVEKSENVGSNDSTSAEPPVSAASSGAGAHHREARRVRPPDVDEHGVAERRPLADELVALEDEIGQVPVQPRVQARGQPGRDVCGENRRGEEDRIRAARLHERRERVHPRLRKRRLERAVLADVDLGRAERAGPRGGLRGAGTEDDPGRLAERGRLGENAEAALLELAVVVLEEDEELHSSRFSTT